MSGIFLLFYCKSTLSGAWSAYSCLILNRSNINESCPAHLETEGQAKSVLEAQSGHEEKFSTDDREIFPQTCFADRGDNIVQHQDSIEGLVHNIYISCPMLSMH